MSNVLNLAAGEAGVSSSAASGCECPECAGRIELTRTVIRGEVIRCGECNAELEVTATSPLRLELAPEVQEDWGE